MLRKLLVGAKRAFWKLRATCEAICIDDPGALLQVTVILSEAEGLLLLAEAREQIPLLRFAPVGMTEVF
jgi:hypothetical protein